MTRLLLDTHVFLWWRQDSARLGAEVRDRIANADQVFVSLASAWEVAIKVALGRLVLPGPFEQGVAESDFEPLPITFAHCDEVARLPPHHRDPFDRMLIAQARVDLLKLVSHDPVVREYDVDLVAV